MDINRDKICGIVQDLLPLYTDSVCSGESKRFVDEHIAQCSKCRKMAEDLEDCSLENTVEAEKEGVLLRHAQKERSAAWKAGAVIAGVLMIPIIITSIVAVTGGTDLGTVLVLIASMGLVAALTVLPMMSRKNRLAKVILAATGAIILIELFVCRFFDGGSFAKIAVPTVFGISVAFFPFVVKGAELPELISNKKGLIVLAWDTIWLYLTIIILNTGKIAAFREAIVISTISVALVWGIFGLTRLPKTKFNRWVKAGFIVILCGIWDRFSEKMSAFLGVPNQFILFTTNGTMDRRVNMMVFKYAVIAGAVLVVIGLVMKSKKK